MMALVSNYLPRTLRTTEAHAYLLGFTPHKLTNDLLKERSFKDAKNLFRSLCPRCIQLLIHVLYLYFFSTSRLSSCNCFSVISF